jgi:hypothetical protein
MPTCLRPACLFLPLLLCPSTFTLATTSPWFPPEEAHKAEVTVLARSTSVRTSNNDQDVYLVEVRPKTGERFLGRVVDSYPSYQGSLPDRLLEADARFTVMLQHDAGCDTKADSMFFPGTQTVADILARETRQDQAKLSTAAPIRCFEAVHKSWKYIGHRSVEVWWT